MKEQKSRLIKCAIKSTSMKHIEKIIICIHKWNFLKTKIKHTILEF